MQHSKQLSYEATDVGSWSFVGLFSSYKNSTDDKGTVACKLENVGKRVVNRITSMKHITS